MAEEDFSLLEELFRFGTYHLAVRKILDLLELESLIKLSQVNKIFYARLREDTERRRRFLRESWLNPTNKQRKRLSVLQGQDMTEPTVVCDETDLVVIAFDPRSGWSSHHFRIASLSLKFSQCLYRVDTDDFPWTQFIGNCSLSRNFLVITPTTPEHEIHLWKRQDESLLGPLVIKQQMSDRYANVIFDNYILMYRTSLFSLFKAHDKEVIKCWSYSGSKEVAETAIVKIVQATQRGIVVWEKSLLDGCHKLQLRSYSNKKKVQIDVNYFNKETFRLNDIVGCNEHIFVADLTQKDGTGVLDVVKYADGNLLKRFPHQNNPHHGWVVHCRSVAPPVFLPYLNVLPFLQYALCLDLECMHMSKKSPSDDHWPWHTESVAYNSCDIFYTDKFNKNLIRIVRLRNQ